MGSNVTDVGLEKKPTRHELKKHAATIHCSNTLSLLQRKITNALLYHAYKELMLKEEHEITVKQLCNLISYNGNNHAVIKDALKGLLSTVIEWNVVNDTTGSEDWTASSMLASVSLQGPLCFYAYSPRMKQLLHSPTMFGKINLFIQSRFKSSYGLALYENCIRYRGLPHTKWFEMEIFRKIMGVPDGKYTIFRDFKKRVLDKSVEEMNTYSDLIVEPEVFKEGRQVVKVRFLLKERPKKTRLGATNPTSEIDDEDSDTGLKTKLVAQFGLSHEQVQQVISEYGIEFVAEKIELIESTKNYQEGKVHNLAGYFLSALKNNYQPSKPSLNRVAEQRQSKYKNLDRVNEAKKLIEEVREAHMNYREEVIDRSLQELSQDARAYFMERFYQHAATAIDTVLRLQRNKYNRDTVIDSPQIKGLLRQFILHELPEIRSQIPGIEKFLERFPDAYRKAWQQLQEPERVSQEVLDI
ncbi:MAG: replication initiation protein [Gammaproteobacteria bacterium]